MLIGMKLLLRVYRIFGRRGFSICLFPVMCYYYLIRKEARLASRQYLHKIKPLLPPEQRASLTPLRHLLMFGEILLDKLLGWMGQITMEDVVFESPDTIRQIDLSRKGGIIVVSHMGNFASCKCSCNETQVRWIAFQNWSRRSPPIDELSEIFIGPTFRGTRANLIPVK